MLEFEFKLMQGTAICGSSQVKCRSRSIQLSQWCGQTLWPYLNSLLRVHWSRFAFKPTKANQNPNFCDVVGGGMLTCCGLIFLKVKNQLQFLKSDFDIAVLLGR
jgi:hypothetical protein